MPTSSEVQTHHQADGHAAPIADTPVSRIRNALQILQLADEQLGNRQNIILSRAEFDAVEQELSRAAGQLTALGRSAMKALFPDEHLVAQLTDDDEIVPESCDADDDDTLDPIAGTQAACMECGNPFTPQHDADKLCARCYVTVKS